MWHADDVPDKPGFLKYAACQTCFSRKNNVWNMIWAWYKHLCSFNFICKEYDIVELQDNDSFILYSNDHCDQPRITFRGFHIYDIKSPLR